MDKPIVQATGEDGNVFSIMGRCSKALKVAGKPEAAKELSERVFACSSYDDALAVMSDYVEFE